MPKRRAQRQAGLASVGELLRRYRKQQHLTQKQLGKKLGSDPSYVARVETGRIKSPGLDSLRRIAAVLELPLSALTGEQGPDLDVERAIMGSDLDEDAKRSLVRMYRALKP
jgi:transcriptional regulator with XRE-family HTH domain